MQRVPYQKLLVVPLFILVTFILSVLHSGCTGTGMKQPVLKAAASTFSVIPKPGGQTDGRTGAKIEEVIGDLKTTIVLLEYGETRLCFLTSPLRIEGGPISTPTFNIANLNIASKALIAKELKITPEQVVGATSHNHTIPRINIKNPEAWGKEGEFPPASESDKLGYEFLVKLSDAARGLIDKLEPVTVEWGIAQETRITYNRKGKRPDGRTYLIREEDRVELGDSYIGLIDPDAIVVVLKGLKGNAVAALTYFTGHPVTGYNPERLVSYGEWPQVACEKLSAHLGNVPVAFFQGCAGDVNSKYMLTGTIAQANEFGEYLGDAFIKAAGDLQPSKRTDLQWMRKKVDIPLADLPDSLSLKKDLASIDDFIRRGDAGDENTLECVGMNFPKALSPSYRARLVELVRPWHVWALEQHRTGKASETPKVFPIEVVVAQFGDVGYVGMPFEPFVRTGLKIRKETPLPCVIPSGYTDGGFGYIPDASGCDDREYMSGFYRYTGNRPPFRTPGGDAVAESVVPVLSGFSEQ